MSGLGAWTSTVTASTTSPRVVLGEGQQVVLRCSSMMTVCRVVSP
jgi:hypothetical protein